MTDRYEGCGAVGCDHHSTGKRAWCTSCSEWCYPDPGMHCARGERDALQARIDAALATVEVWAQNADARSIVEYTRGECARIVRAALTEEAS